MRWGQIGGGRGSQIGEAHRIAARLDGLFELSAGALDVDPLGGKQFGLELGIRKDRAYGDWREMLSGESRRLSDERLNLVTVATPNATHFEITKAFLEAGFSVLCEKPLTMTINEADELCALADRGRIICAVNFGYSGYPMAIQEKKWSNTATWATSAWSSPSSLMAPMRTLMTVTIRAFVGGTIPYRPV